MDEPFASTKLPTSQAPEVVEVAGSGAVEVITNPEAVLVKEVTEVAMVSFATCGI